MKLSHEYDDIIHLPHHVSDKRPHMSMLDRAAQFAPFAALTGYGEAITETARLTDSRLELDEEQKLALSERLRLLREALPDAPELVVTYFLPDAKKAGGAYLTISGRAKKVDPYASLLLLEDGTKIPFDDIYAIGGELFDQ